MIRYVLITAARNESAIIETTLKSVVSQTQLPERWVIVDDGSTDETPNHVGRYAAQHPWIELIRRPQRADRSFAGKAQAVNLALERMKDIAFEVVGNLDADVSFEPDYMAFVVEKFAGNPKLGVAGTPFTEVGGYDSTRDSFEGQNYVAGPCQLFRRTCWQGIGGYVVWFNDPRPTQLPLKDRFSAPPGNISAEIVTTGISAHASGIIDLAPKIGRAHV